VVPAFILCVSFIGFGALAEGAGFGLVPALYTTVFVFALPGQVVLVDQVSRGMPLLSTALAVTVTAVRLLPMTVTLMPYLRSGTQSRRADYFASHFVAVTIWLEALRQTPSMPRKLRLPYYFGLATILVSVSIIGTVTGYLGASYLPESLSAALIFLSPLYFLLGLLGNGRSTIEIAPILCGFALAPFLTAWLPAVDLLLTGLIGGSAAFLARRRLDKRKGDGRGAGKPDSAA
jgi:predicted branched-subunit amino acid permease